MARGVICAPLFVYVTTMYQFLPCHYNKILLLLTVALAKVAQVAPVAPAACVKLKWLISFPPNVVHESQFYRNQSTIYNLFLFCQI